MSQINLIRVVTIMQVPVFLFHKEEDGSKTTKWYETKIITESELYVYPKLRDFKEVNILNHFE